MNEQLDLDELIRRGKASLAELKFGVQRYGKSEFINKVITGYTLLQRENKEFEKFTEARQETINKLGNRCQELQQKYETLQKECEFFKIRKHTISFQDISEFFRSERKDSKQLYNRLKLRFERKYQRHYQTTQLWISRIKKQITEFESYTRIKLDDLTTKYDELKKELSPSNGSKYFSYFTTALSCGSPILNFWYALETQCHEGNQKGCIGKSYVYSCLGVIILCILLAFIPFITYKQCKKCYDAICCCKKNKVSPLSDAERGTR